MTHRDRILKQLADGAWYTRVELGIESGSVRLLYGMANDNQIRFRKMPAHRNGGNPAWQFALGAPKTTEEIRCREYMVDTCKKREPASGKTIAKTVRSHASAPSPKPARSGK